jgi:hypothetical protein
MLYPPSDVIVSIGVDLNAMESRPIRIKIILINKAAGGEINPDAHSFFT